MKMIQSYVLFVVSVCSLVFASQPHNSNNNYGPNPSSYHGGSGSYPPPPQSQTEDERLYYEKQKQQQQLYQQINKQGGSAPPPPLPPHMSSTYSYGTHPNAPNHLQHPQQNMFSSTDPSRPVGYNSGYAPIVPRPPSYDRIQPQVQESSGTGLFAKLKSSIFAAGSAISESLSGPYYDEGRPLQQQQHQQQLLPLPPPPPVYSRPPLPPPHDSSLGGGGGRGGPFPGYSQSPTGQRVISPSGLSHTGGAGQHQYGSSSQPISQEESSSSAGGGVGLIDKIKTLFNAEDSSSSSGGGGLSYPNSRDFQGQYVPQQPSYPPRQQQQQPFNGPLGSPPHLNPYENHQPVAPKDSRGVPADLHPANIPGFPSPQQQQQQQQQYMAAGTASSTYRDDYRGEGYGGSNIDTTAIPNSPSYNYPPHMRGPASPLPPPPPGRSSIPGQGYDQYDNRETQLHYSNNQPPPNYPGYGQPPQMPPNYPQMPLPEPVDPISLISPDPQVFNYDGSTSTTHSDPSSSCIVMISKPREFFKKKQTFTQAGTNNIQVFSDFEHVFTRFITAEGDRTLGSAELLESSGAVQRSAVDKLNKISEEFENNMDHDAYQELNARCQEVIAREGMLHIAAVAPVTKEFTKQLGLRDGWKEAMSSLASRGVPIYLFSSGYGDVVTQVLIQGLADSSSSSSNGAGSSSSNSPMSSGTSTLPQNIRVISNFFRTAPDGTVRAFSQPIIHERNKNASTAATQMGFSVLPRPYALVLGSHEDDISMTEGVVGLKEQISIGFIELSEDIAQRLPIFLNAFDVVIVGDGSFKYVRSTIDDVLQIISSSTTSTSGSTSSQQQQRSSSSSIALGLKNRLGMFLNPSSSSSPSPGTNAAGPTADNISTGFYRPQQPLNQQPSNNNNNNYQQPPPPTEVYRKSYLDYQDF